MNKEYPSLESIENIPLYYYLRQITKGASVLEFGAASGYMTKYLREERECRVTCIEINPQSAKVCKQYAEKVVVADIDTGDWDGLLEQEYDYILFADVLEHLREPERTLTKALNFLALDGTVITSIPNIAHSAIILSLLRGRFEYTTFGLLDDTHIHFFTRQSMTEMFERNGLISIEENNSIRLPSRTELREHYCSSPFFSLTLLRKPDAHVYQFISMWKRKQEGNVKGVKNGYRIPFYRIPYLCCLDFKDYLFNRHRIDCLKWFRRNDKR